MREVLTYHDCVSYLKYWSLMGTSVKDGIKYLHEMTGIDYDYYVRCFARVAHELNVSLI